MNAKKNRDWADTGDHDFLCTIVGHQIRGVQTSTRDGIPRLELVLDDGRTFAVEAEGAEFLRVEDDAP